MAEKLCELEKSLLAEIAKYRESLGIPSSNRGEKNFGWDSIFMPHGHQKTFAEMGSEEKNSISHRYLAAQKFLFFLEKRLS